MKGGTKVEICVSGSHARLLPHFNVEVSVYPSNDIIHHHQLLDDKER